MSTQIIVPIILQYTLARTVCSYDSRSSPKDFKQEHKEPVQPSNS